MIFDYFRPERLLEATEYFTERRKEGGIPLFFGGGTEIITMQRLHEITLDTAIDIKAIDAVNIHDIVEGYVAIGAAVTLTEIQNKNLFPLLTEVSKEVADRTARNKITLGGNICGNIFYREAVLPLLLADSLIVTAKERDIRMEYISAKFKQKMLLEEGEVFVQAFVEEKYRKQPFYTRKKRQQWETGYPLITAAALKVDQKIRVAFSGLCAFPFRSNEMEAALNEAELSAEQKINKAIQTVPGEILDDVEGSREYRLFVLRNLLEEILQSLERM
ncbi:MULTISPECIES: FAD binding domain-containing protein [Bacillaceae]|uniref:FAD binding domain-containing protein n=1 Tax=Bacillaceae TaxID=186817 RepID=UPI001E45D38B|nr:MULTISPECIES: FAD binding domain-containing protein [Bacillaceae]MCE4047965.1 FAD binding domain-containing protein [Bacillus sp. Au-Bac7]MCM3032496.1 FAD binding domain-containing protein [Niallia sp. MER 6]